MYKRAHWVFWVGLFALWLGVLVRKDQIIAGGAVLMFLSCLFPPNPPTCEMYIDESPCV